jgi:alanine dehydrogenase
MSVDSCKIINSETIKNIIPMKKAIELVENAFFHVSENKVQMPSKVYLDLPQYNGDFRAMPVYSSADNMAGIKWVNSHSNNFKYGKPAVMATLLLNDPHTGELLAILDAGELTAIRTGAAGGVAIKYLSNPGASAVALIGAGKQAYYQALALLEVCKPNTIHIYDINEKNMYALKDHLAPFYSGIISCCSTAKKAVENSSTLITTTPGLKTIIDYNWVQKGTHINAIGADAQGKQELDIRLLQESRIIVDDFEQASHSGEVNVAFSKGLISKENLSISISDIVSGKHKGRLHNDDITIFDSTGLAIQDIAVASYVYKKIISI